MPGPRSVPPARHRRGPGRPRDLRHERSQRPNWVPAHGHVAIEPPAEGDEEVTGYNPVIIAEATTSLKRLSVSEAVMELDLSGAPCLVFQHGVSGRVNIIYRRADGNIGWIDPPLVKA